MARLRTHGFTISLDGYAAALDQGPDAPYGVGGERVHDWMRKTRAFRRSHGADGGETGPNDDLARERLEGVGATIMGRNMFGPVRSPWRDDSWRGWWGEDPPFGHDVFVMTHNPRAPTVMGNGTTFRFVAGTAAEVREMALQAARGPDVEVGGGVATLRQFLADGLIDDLHLVVAPILLGRGESLFGGLDSAQRLYQASALVAHDGVAHTRLTRLP